MASAPGGHSFASRRFALLSHSYYSLWGFRLPIMKRLVAGGARVFAVAPEPEGEETFGEHGIDYVPFPIHGTSLRPVHDVHGVRRLARQLDKLRPDVLQTFSPKTNLVGAWAARRNVPRVISTVTGLGSLYVHDDGLVGRTVARSADRITRPALRNVSAVVFQNPDDREEFLERRLCRPDQARLILSSGVDLTVYSPQAVSEDRRAALRAQWGIEPSEVVVTMIARLLPAKGVNEFVTAARALRGRARFVLVGDRSGRSPLSQKARSDWHAAGVIAPGKQLNIPEWLAISDVYTLPSYYREGVPRANLEAMAMELPIVTTRMPGCRETVVDGENGLLVRPRDAAELTEALRLLVADEALRRRMGTRSRELARERFALELVVEQYLQLYDEVLGRHTGGPGPSQV